MSNIKRYLITFIPVAIVLIGGWQYRWVAEDAYIDFRVVHNLLKGYGPVFNPGERVEVYTDPLWIAILSIFAGMFRFITVQWWSVVLGMTFTGGGFWLGGLATTSLASHHSNRDIIPIGTICASVVGGVWIFVTSGLETGLVFGWLGLSWWLMVRALLYANQGIYLTAIILSLGFIIRPDMAVFTLTCGIALLILMRRNSTGSSNRGVKSYTALTFSLIGLPVISELFRIAYFGLLVSNTALAKSASAVWLGQGWAYLKNFVEPYWIWIPFVVLGINGVIRMWNWWIRGLHVETLVVLAFVSGGVLDISYVVRVGGDFMHARMLLPGFFSIFLTFWFEEPLHIKGWLPVIATCTWVMICLCFLRFTVQGIGANGIANERMFYIGQSGASHPITPADYRNTEWEKDGYRFSNFASMLNQSEKKMSWNLSAVDNQFVTAKSRLPELYYVGYGNIGIMGLAAGDKVYVFDELSLANPIGSHFSLVTRTRPGHEKDIGLVWMVARFGVSSLTAFPPQTSRTEFVAARRALHCQPLAGYLESIDQPLTVGGVIRNFEHVIEWTTMSFSSNPVVAIRQLCG